MTREQVAEAMAAIWWQPTYSDIERDEDGDFVESKHYLILRELVIKMGDWLNWYWFWEGHEVLDIYRDVTLITATDDALDLRDRLIEIESVLALMPTKEDTHDDSQR